MGSHHARAVNRAAEPASPMPQTDWTSPRTAKLPYSDANFALAKVFFFGKWCERSVQRELPQPLDLTGACKYGSLFMQCVFGGALRGHYEHQYNFIDGRLVDLSHDAADVGRMTHPICTSLLTSSSPRCRPRWTAACLMPKPGPRSSWRSAFEVLMGVRRGPLGPRVAGLASV